MQVPGTRPLSWGGVQGPAGGCRSKFVTAVQLLSIYISPGGVERETGHHPPRVKRRRELRHQPVPGMRSGVWGRQTSSVNLPREEVTKYRTSRSGLKGMAMEPFRSKAQELMTKRSQRSLKRALRRLGRSSSCTSAAFMMSTDAPKHRRT